MNSIILLASILLTGLAATFFAPLQSLYLVTQMDVPSQYVGAYFFLGTVLSIFLSQRVATYSDKQVSRLPLIRGLSAMGVVSMFVFAYSTNLYVIITTGFLGVSFAIAVAPQLFAYARESYRGDKGDVFMSWARAMISIAWVIGPPLSFSVVSFVDYSTAFMISAGMYLCVLLLSFTMIADVRECTNDEAQEREQERDDTPFWTTNVVLVSLGFCLFYLALNAYMLAFPIYMVEVLGEPEASVGGVFSLTALIEVPAIILCGYLIKRAGSLNLVVLASVVLCAYLTGVVFAQSYLTIYFLVPLAALAVALNSSAGLAYYQSLTETRLGYASTVYNNVIRFGMGVGSLVFGLSGYFDLAFSLKFGAVCALLSFLLLIFSVRYKRQTQLAVEN